VAVPGYKMPCYTPITAYVAMGKNDNGKKIIVFKRPELYMEQINLPCGQCIGCKLRRSITWAARCMHEMQLHDNNCFITLTYDEEQLPNDHSLSKHHFQKFLKRLRHDIQPLKIRYFMAGEYGDSSWRPHYHAIIFNYDFPDKIRIQSKEVDNPYFISSQLSKLWTYGYHIIAQANFDTAAYVARYCTKKITGEKSEAHYQREILDWNEVTGEVNYYKQVNLEPEYATMSRRPAIGKEWFKKYKSDCYPSDYLVHEGRKLPIPQYYDKLLESEDEHLYRIQKTKRRLNAILNKEQLSLSRLYQINEIKKHQFKSMEKNKI